MTDARQLIFEVSRGFPIHERGYTVAGFRSSANPKPSSSWTSTE